MSIRATISLTAGIVILATLGACSKGPASAAGTEKPAGQAAERTAQGVPLATSRDAAAPATAAPVSGEAARASLTTVTGTVLETMNAAGYTYLRLKTPGGETWAAVNEAVVKVGAEVTVVDAMTMDGFSSKTLNRTFEKILFGTLAEGGAPASPHGAMSEEASLKGKAAEPAETIHVAKAEGKDGRTVEEVYAQRFSLKGQKVRVRGKVVKQLPGIMGRTWIHVRDGSGSREKKNDDLTITTDQSVTVGDVVVFQGTVGVDRDFGAGYVYTVILEGAIAGK